MAIKFDRDIIEDIHILEEIYEGNPLQIHLERPVCITQSLGLFDQNALFLVSSPVKNQKDKGITTKRISIVTKSHFSIRFAMQNRKYCGKPHSNLRRVAVFRDNST